MFIHITTRVYQGVLPVSLYSRLTDKPLSLQLISPSLTLKCLRLKFQLLRRQCCPQISNSFLLELLAIISAALEAYCHLNTFFCSNHIYFQNISSRAAYLLACKSHFTLKYPIFVSDICIDSDHLQRTSPQFIHLLASESPTEPLTFFSMSPSQPKNGKKVGVWHEIMDPNGDITLLVGEEKRKLRVARNILCLGSPVFAKMLAPGSHFMEAQVTILSDDGTKHISLLADELEPLTLVLRIMHHRTKDVPTELSLDPLSQVAVLCDKYDLLGCIRQWTTSWCGGSVAKEDRRWLLIAFVFENANAFREITKSLILHGQTNDWKSLDIVNDLDGVPAWILGERGMLSSLCVSANVAPQNR